MELDRFDFALFIKDETASDKELRVRKVLYLDEKCNLYILMRRKSKAKNSTDWRLLIQTIHAMVFLVPDATTEDSTVMSFNKPLIYKDMLLSAVFADSIDSSMKKDMPPWLYNTLAADLFDCFYKCSLRVILPQDNSDYSYYINGNQESKRYLLQAIIKPCPSHFSTYQLSTQINSLPQFPTQAYVDTAIIKKLIGLMLLDDNSTSNVHSSLSLSVVLFNSLDLVITGQNGDLQLAFKNRGDYPITIMSFSIYITDVVFVDDQLPENQISNNTDFAIMNSFELPKHNPTIITDIHLSADSLSGPTIINNDSSHVIHTHIEYTQNHASTFAAQEQSERSECDVYTCVHIVWKQPMSLYPLSRDYDVRVRLHPKPQIAVAYRTTGNMVLQQPNRIKIEVTNLSMHVHRQFQVRFEERSDVLCNVVSQVINESLPHSIVTYTVIVVPQIPGNLTLPSIMCIDDKGKLIPSQSPSISVIVTPLTLCYNKQNIAKCYCQNYSDYLYDKLNR